MSPAPHVLIAVPLEGLVDGDMVPAPAATLHHLRRVLRHEDGAALSLTDGEGLQAFGVLEGEGLRLMGDPRVSPAPSPRLVLAQALAKGRRTDDAVRVACELGVDRIVPVVAERTQGRPDAGAGAALVERWRAVATAALEQSRGVRLAQVEGPVDGLLGVDVARPGSALRLIAVPGARELPAHLAETLVDGALEEVVLAIGPEGGWSDGEVERACADGWVAVGLGPQVLRTEHAGPVAVAVTAAILGRWRAEGA